MFCITYRACSDKASTPVNNEMILLSRHKNVDEWNSVYLQFALTSKADHLSFFSAQFQL